MKQPESKGTSKENFLPTGIAISQGIYVLLALTYNLVSAAVPLAPTNPLAGSMFVLFYGSVVLAGIRGYKRFYGIAMILFTLMLLVSGIALHVMNFIENPKHPPGYMNSWALWLAVALNVFGVALAVVGAFRSLREKTC